MAGAIRERGMWGVMEKGQEKGGGGEGGGEPQAKNVPHCVKESEKDSDLGDTHSLCLRCSYSLGVFSSDSVSLKTAELHWKVLSEPRPTCRVLVWSGSVQDRGQTSWNKESVCSSELCDSFK